MDALTTMAKATKPVYDEGDVIDEAAEMVDAMIAPTPNDQAALNARMVDAIEALAKKNESGPIPQIPVHKYRGKTPWNPTGARRRTKFERPVYINGTKVSQIMHSDEEIDKLNRLKPGRYYNRKIAVWTTDTSEGVSALHLNFPNKTPDQKYEMMQLSAPKGLVGILDVILAEQDAVAPAR